MWHSIVETSLTQFRGFLKESDWFGRENEIVNLYAHQFLAYEIHAHGPFSCLTQIGIEVGVTQVTGSVKKYVRKDLVIWPKPRMTIWTKGAVPAVVIEWKRDSIAATKADIRWLCAFTKRYPGTLGVTACAFMSDPRGLAWSFVERGRLSNESLGR